jgi:drug/metabolite transporter (DMT)-like permease
MGATEKGARRAVAALLFNAFTWGVSWWPLRQLQEQGLHPLWTTVLTFALAALLITLYRPAAWREVASTPSLWLLMLGSGVGNAAFNWGVTTGDVVRVVLLFYLMPLWAVLLARSLLGEALTGATLLRVALALAGAAVVLWPADGAGLPLPRTGPEWLGLVGGFGFALNNVLLRREAQRSSAALALAMFSGGAAVAGAAALLFGAQAGVPWPPAPHPVWLSAVGVIGLVFLAGNLSLQYWASRLPAQTTAVIMVSEVLFASVSAVLLGAGVVTAPLALGGALIVGASLLAARGGTSDERTRHP